VSDANASSKPDLTGRIALVTGASRGAGRAIAVELGAAGATAYVTGRTTASTASPMQRAETIDETANLIDEAGGHGIAIRADHQDRDQVEAVAERIRSDHGRLDVLVNDIWGGDPLTQWEVPFWEQDLDQGLGLLRQGINTHITTSVIMAPLVLQSEHGLIVEVTDGVSSRYRGSLFYDLVKSSVIRLAIAQGEELRERGVAAVAVSPGFLRSEAMLDRFGITEATWRDAIAQDEHFEFSETPHYLGRAIACLAADLKRMELTATATATWELVNRYGFTDIDGSQPRWGDHMRAAMGLEP
jgi:NAD(P)-dependent dehydrogenase (short-subunit alcohol dehydrogenase family)